jgi:anti-sigma-K factor RskA
MIEYTCRDIDELLAGYVADALVEDERCSVNEHLAECRRHDVELTAMRADIERLALSVQPVEPPASLRGSLLAAFDEAVAAPEPAPLEIQTVRAARAKRSVFSTSGFAYAVAAAMLVLAVGLGAWGLSRDSGDGGSDVLVAQSRQGDASLQVMYVPSQQVAVMEVDLPSLPAGRVYQAWRIDGGAPTSLGLVETTSGSIAVQADLTGATAIALSVEPSGGSPAPTTNPILIANLDKS